MSRVRLTIRMLTAALAIAALLSLLVLAWGLRPPLPNLNRSPTGPPAHVVAKQILDVLAWVLTITVTLRLLKSTTVKAVRTRLPGSRAASVRLDDALKSRPVLDEQRWPLVHLAAPRAYPLIIRPAQPPTQPTALPPTTPSAARATDPPPHTKGRSISILGPLKIEGARQRGRKLRSLTAQMLLYLVLHPEGATVEQLADALLPETDPDRSRNRLWQSASEARRVFGDGFRRDDGRYSLDRAMVQIDLDELNVALGNHHFRDGASGTAGLDQALSLFRGDPLQDTDWTWAEGHKRHLRATYVDLIEQVGRATVERGNPRRALELAERGLAVDEFNEALWCLAMEADAAAGLRDSVGQRYAQLRCMLDRELGLEPSAETRGLYRKLLGQS